LTILETILFVLIIAQAAAIAWLVNKLYGIGILVLTVQDVLEESLEIVDDRIESIDDILAIPLFSDSPEIKKLQNDMTSSRDAILEVAYALSSSMSKEDADPETE
jgi:hypothetical protein